MDTEGEEEMERGAATCQKQSSFNAWGRGVVGGWGCCSCGGGGKSSDLKINNKQIEKNEDERCGKGIREGRGGRKAKLAMRKKIRASNRTAGLAA